jgi:hypothetical protein
MFIDFINIHSLFQTVNREANAASIRQQKWRWFCRVLAKRVTVLTVGYLA